MHPQTFDANKKKEQPDFICASKSKKDDKSQLENKNETFKLRDANELNEIIDILSNPPAY